MKIITVNASKIYNITVTNGLGEFSSSVMPLIKGDKVAIITDTNVSPIYFDAVKNLITNKTVEQIVITAGEESKNATTYIEVANTLSKLGFTRKDTVIGLGGGVVGDLAALVASTYMRGINYIAMPTSLLSMVDSSVGGKTAINLDSGKNLLGTFFQPDAVYINVDFLNTLPKREVTCGLGEIMKYAFIDNRITKDAIEKANYFDLIVKSLEIKRDIVEEDEKESGKRMLLNFGHTVGHAIEKLSDYTLSHGECVIKGMYYALNLSKNLGYLSESDYDNAVKFISLSGVTLNVEYCKEEIENVIKNDKKFNGSEMNFVLTSGFGNAFVEKIKISDLVDKIW